MERIASDILKSDLTNVDDAFENNRPYVSYYLDSILGNVRPSEYFKEVSNDFGNKFYFDNSYRNTYSLDSSEIRNYTVSASIDNGRETIVYFLFEENEGSIRLKSIDFRVH